MCNEFARRLSLGQLREDWAETRIPLVFPEGLPNLAPEESIRITDTALVLRAGADGGVEGVMRRWSWPGPGGRPVYNYRSEHRPFANAAGSGRCLIPVDAFYEHTPPPEGAPKRAKKTKWRFAAAPASPLAAGADAAAWFCIAGFWRSDPAVGEAFTLLTGEPGPDVAPYHHRQVLLPPRAAWAGWLDGSLPAEAVLGPAPAHSLVVARVSGRPPEQHRGRSVRPLDHETGWIRHGL